MAHANLTLGVNLRGFVASVNMRPGEASIAQDILPRDDGSFFKHWGWVRKNTTALTTTPMAIKGFSYKGKNNDTVANPARAGNFGIADDGAIFTKRLGLYSTAIVLTETECRYWDPATSTWAGPVALPGGVALTPGTKPTITIYNDNAYIVGWADANLRYDPVDRVLYEWGFAAAPANAGHTGVGAGGTLVANAVYRYRLSWVDLYTGEESLLSVVYEQTTTDANRTITLDGFVAYAGARHYIDAVNLTNNDVGIVVYRTGPDQQTYYFLDIVNPGVAAATVTDNGLATDFSIKADTRAFQDVPHLDQIVEYRNQWYGLSWDENFTRMYFNDFQAQNSFWERTDVRNFRDLPLGQGEILMAITNSDGALVALSTNDAYEVKAIPTDDGQQLSVRPMEWTVGCVGPRAWAMVDTWLYFLSERGPYRWRPGLLEPQWIGRMIAPIFMDPESGLCQLTEGLRSLSEVCYDQDARVIRWIFPCGATTVMNRHYAYWVDAAKYNDDPETGWFACSTTPQCMDLTHAIEPLVAGVPVDPFEKRARLVFADQNGYVSEYDPDSGWRGGLPTGTNASGIAQAGSGVALIVTLGSLWQDGDDMEGMRLEVVHLDGTIDVREIASNTAANIIPTVNFSQDPTGATWYAAGIPAYWRSWVDHNGDPKSHKSLIHLWSGLNREFMTDTQVIDVSVGVSGDWPTTAGRVKTIALNKHRDQALISLTGRYFTYEYANSRPDEPFMITYIDPEFIPAGVRRG